MKMYSLRRRKRLMQQLASLTVSAHQLKILLEGAPDGQPPREYVNELESCEIALIEDMDKVGRVIDPEHEHYEEGHG